MINGLFIVANGRMIAEWFQVLRLIHNAELRQLSNSYLESLFLVCTVGDKPAWLASLYFQSTSVNPGHYFYIQFMFTRRNYCTRAIQ